MSSGAVWKGVFVEHRQYMACPTSWQLHQCHQKYQWGQAILIPRTHQQKQPQCPKARGRLQVSAFENPKYEKWSQKSKNWSQQYGSWRDWRDNSKRWKKPDRLNKELKFNLSRPSVYLPVLGSLAIATTLGPLILAIAAGTLGVVFASVAGATAVALFLPAALFIGGTLTAFSLLGSVFSLLGFVPLAALGWFFYSRSGRAKVESAKQAAQIKEDAWQAREYRRQQEELELMRVESEELADFDQRLRSK